MIPRHQDPGDWDCKGPQALAASQHVGAGSVFNPLSGWVD